MAAALCCASHVGCSKAVINILWEHIFWKSLYAVNAERHFATSAQSQYFLSVVWESNVCLPSHLKALMQHLTLKTLGGWEVRGCGNHWLSHV